VVAHPLMTGLPPPNPGLVRASGPPRVLYALWARVSFKTPDDLARALARLDPHVSGPRLRRALVQVRYRPDQLTAEVAAHHAAFAARHPETVSTYLPFCLPGSPQYATMGAFATPADCHGCLFYRGMACQGLGGDPGPWSALTGAEALPLESVTRDVHDYARADFAGKRPLAYWLPTRRIVAQIGRAVRDAGGRLLDLGGGNGFLAGLLAADEGLDVTVVDLAADYPTPPGVRRVVGDVREVADAPNALLISYPPTGDGFRDLVDRLDPEVVVYAFDAEGFCGRRPGFAGVIATGDGLEWFDYPVNDFARRQGRTVRCQWRVRTYQDLRRGSGRRGVVQIRARSAVRDVPVTGRYAWE
jgi:hypothetical protein